MQLANHLVPTRGVYQREAFIHKLAGLGPVGAHGA